ncbi:TRAP transporter large permease [Natronolimnohabitans innermongolicus]|uniref:TRAP C4-dicarboxylate transport system permease DctM subunit n=1 Tax=Natronolimnohabitans innermongolicus JCM 12255 TaxID=1227499 RepID=L9X2H9_9EURY|nr:TRAP transporter large permease [Natronolimnohabitans innermongolicus]ELY55959.1 TRAP C4-dicarboxylate transport system permease DctM subunit [Natronolimnohabitans innermongolicus JCM 12255]
MIELSPELALLLLTLLCAALFVLGVQIFLVFGLWAVGFHALSPGFPVSNVSVLAFSELESFTYVAIPLFVLVGDLINRARISEEIIEFSRACIGWLPGSTGNTSIGCSAVFSAITGSNAATTASVGKALHPVMDREGYDDSYAAATIASGGIVGTVLPPSVLLIVYGVMYGVSVPDMFIAGIVPGIAILIGLVVVNTALSQRHDYGMDSSEFEFQARRVLKTAWEAKVGLGTIVILLGGIYVGLFTPSEAAAVAVFYILLSAVALGKITRLEQVVSATFTSLLLIGVILPIVVVAVAIQQNLSYLGIQDAVSEAILSLGEPWLIILAMMVIMLATGSVLASVPNIALTVPLLTPAAMELGLDPVTWAIIFIISDAIGFITPPYGLNLYIISGITDIDYMEVTYEALPYLAMLIGVWSLFFIFPELNVLA